ncbi:DUF7010 family protein [Alkalicoccus halolimnae]|uniref:Uncharacterized protein n=1 Tax=Alkalicoccus halolimnae TaxID=1667239 RepID=A0A5C7F9R0_9BACI|nr:hypothetical protein [Alkalicoccus halolimnae]TXF86128.1 hypothetical protein FTX54_05800 [Alkalicoccus halolimnae]
MDELSLTLTELALHNYSGAPFLGAYGLTWLVCAWLWRKFSLNIAAVATIFQGMVALPIALGISASLGMLTNQPGGELITQLSILLSMSQMLVLPLLIVLSVKGNLTAIPLIFALTVAIHFVPYAWLYQTLVYIGMAVLQAVALAFLYGTDKNKPVGQLMSKRGASLVCAVTGVLMLATGLIFIV